MNQTFKKSVLAVSVAVGLSAVAGSVAANQFDASVPGSFTSTVVLKTGSALPKWLTTPVLAESGIWNSGTSAPVAVRFTVPAGVELWGSVMDAITAAAAPSNTATDVTALMTAGTTYKIYTSAVANTKYGYAYVDLTGTNTFTANKQFALFGLIGASDGTDYSLAGLKAGVATSAGTVFALAGAASGTTTTATGAANTPIVRTNTGAATVGASNNQIGSLTLNADGTQTIVIYASAPNATISNDTIQLPAIPVSASATAAAGSVSLGYADGPAAGSLNVLGITDTSIAVATVTPNLVSVAGSATGVTPPALPVGVLPAQASGRILITFADAVTASSSHIKVALSNGAKFKAGVTGSDFSITGGNSTNLVNANSQVVVDANGVLDITLDDEAIAAGDTITLPAGSTVIDMSGVTAAGDINATVTATSTALASFGSTSVKVATAVAKGATLSFVDAGTVGYTKLYTGRDAVGFTASEGLRVKESVFGSLANGGEVVLTLDKGAKFDNGTSVTATGTQPAVSMVTIDATTSSATIRGVVSNPSTATASQVDFTGYTFDLQDATSGDLSVTFSGSAGVAGTIKLAELVDASVASVAGAITNIAQSTSGVSIPSIVITESATGALATGNLDLVLDNGATWNTASGVTATVAGGNLAPGAISLATTNITNDTLRVAVTAGTSAATTITVAKASINTSVGSGAVKVKTQGTALPTKQTFAVANVLQANNPSYPTATVADQTKLTLTNLPLVAAGNDQGKQGAVYVALIFQGNVFFQGADGSWSAFTSAANVPAYFTGTLGTTNLNIVPTALDVSGAKGALFVAGYGLGIAGLGNPFDDFIKNARYNVVYQVK